MNDAQTHAPAWPPRTPSLGGSSPEDCPPGARPRAALSPRTRARHDRGCATNHGGALYAQCARLYMLYSGAARAIPKSASSHWLERGKRPCWTFAVKGRGMDRSVARCGGDALTGLSRAGGVSLSEVSAHPAAGSAERAKRDRLMDARHCLGFRCLIGGGVSPPRTRCRPRPPAASRLLPTTGWSRRAHHAAAVSLL